MSIEYTPGEPDSWNWPDGYECDFMPCEICGAETFLESCWSCGGEGGHHDCGEDSCPCLYPEPNVNCDICDGKGSYHICTRLPHTDEQMTAWRAKVDHEKT